ncbi:hypothetical protein [Paenibacillus cymbidii]|uniref:hypothetical protein n=1 Tax=Paenibacillus cymbidii TaxID=1639034 RepID=UPI00143691D7|nr:hypothetical protein [Paenibacillus cymbidii]
MNAGKRLTTQKEKAQELQRALYLVAKENPKRRNVEGKYVTAPGEEHRKAVCGKTARTV